mmetsp:Transcript_9304/g.11765  ORF Transcript_9304/g.11765 Transcript_9304/m.11765 type:complete len:121 (+) Transcript_9304:2252-2614(+)
MKGTPFVSTIVNVGIGCKNDAISVCVKFGGFVDADVNVDDGVNDSIADVTSVFAFADCGYNEIIPAKVGTAMIALLLFLKKSRRLFTTFRFIHDSADGDGDTGGDTDANDGDGERCKLLL